MRNLKFVYKMLLVVGVLVITAVVIAAVGVVQLNTLNERIQTLIDVTVRNMHVARRMRVELLENIRYEKNVILSTSDEESKRFADEGRQANERVEQLREELIKLTENRPEDRSLVETFNRNWEDYKKAQKEILRLGLLNGEAKAQALMSGRLLDRTSEVSTALEAIVNQVDKEMARPDVAEDLNRLSNLYKKSRAANTALADLRELFVQLTLHLYATTDKDLDKFDGTIKDLLTRIRTHLADLRASVNDRERLELERVTKAMADIEEAVKQVQGYSREKSIAKATALSLGPARVAAVACDNALEKLLVNIHQRMDEDKVASQRLYETSRWTTLGVAAAGILISLFLAVAVTRSITRAIGRCVTLFDQVAKGDLTGRLDLDQKDEIGRLSKSMDKVTETMQKIVGGIRTVSQSISTSAEDLSRVSQGLLAQSEEMTVQAGSVASGTEQMATNIQTMAATAEQMSVNVSSISSASEEVSVNVGTIAQAAENTTRNVESVNVAIDEISKAIQTVADEARDGAQLTSQAWQMANQATQTMNTLDRSATEINKVTELIKMIALQTNLLALNATIEATSAGEAGKGFAVVAGEIKELANQSARAAEEITRKIEGVQDSTREAVKAIEGVAQTINNVNSSARRVSDAVAQQTQVAQGIVKNVNQASKGVVNIAKSIAEVAKGANDMSRNTGEASKGASDVSRNASEAAKAAELVASNIHEVSQATRQSTTNATRVHESAQGLQRIASDLAKAVNQFRLEK
jgi:methyl-accepting chemotaxis protein